MNGEQDTRRIVVGVDESESAAAAVRWAVAEADLDDAEVIGVMAWSFIDQHHDVEGAPFDPAYGEEEARQALERYVISALGADRAARVRTRVVSDLPASTLLEASRGADLLVVGARGVGGFRGLLLGSVSERVLHQANIPIAIVRERSDRSPAPTARVAVGIDGSEPAQRALQWAIAEARLRSAALDVVHVWQLPFRGYARHAPSSFDTAAQEDASRRMLDDAISAQDTQGVAVNPVSLRGGTVAGLLEVGDTAGLLVVGSRGRDGFERMLLGSVATQISHHARGPLVVVPPLDTFDV